MIIWNVTASGEFSCQSAYKVLHGLNHELPHSSHKWRVIWKSKLSNKLKHFIWLAVQDKLMTNVLRFSINMALDAVCSQCGEVEESVVHMLRHCRTAK